VRQLYATGRRQDEVQCIDAKDLAGGDGDQRAPAMSAAKGRIAGGAGDLAVRRACKNLDEEILDRAPHLRLGGVEIFRGRTGPDRTTPSMAVPQARGELMGK
jgi:hypothetical protein